MYDFEQRLAQHGKDLKESMTAPHCAVTAVLPATETHAGKRRTRLYFAAAAVAAAVCVCIGGTMLLHKPTGTAPAIAKNNLFSVTAYAASESGELAKKLTITQEEDADPAQDMYWLAIEEEGDAYAVTAYKNIGFQCTGENIQSVAFETDTGFFAREIKDANGGTQLEKIGGTYVVGEEDIQNCAYVYWGMTEDISETGKIAADVSQIAIRIRATFDDGSTQSENYVYNVNAGTLVLTEK